MRISNPRIIHRFICVKTRMISFKTILIVKVEIHLSIGYSFERANKFREFRGFSRLTSGNSLFVFLSDLCANFEAPWFGKRRNNFWIRS